VTVMLFGDRHRRCPTTSLSHFARESGHGGGQAWNPQALSLANRTPTSEISVGLVLQAAFDFLAIAAAVYVFIIVPVNKLMELRRRGKIEEAEAVPEDIALLGETRDLLARQSGPSI
jgi:large-conductance mechanosensitive channel